MRRSLRLVPNLLASLVLTALLVPPLAAQSAHAWVLRGSGSWAESAGKVGGYSYFDNSERLDAGEGRGMRLAVERRWGRGGVELSYEELSFDTDLTFVRSFGPIAPAIVTGASGSFTIRPLTLALLLHATPGSRLEVFGGPAVSWVSYSVDPGPAREAEPGYGGVLGLEVPFGERWAAGLTVRYLEVAHESVDDRDYWGGLGVPIGSAGVSYRF